MSSSIGALLFVIGQEVVKLSPLRRIEARRSAIDGEVERRLALFHGNSVALMGFARVKGA